MRTENEDLVCRDNEGDEEGQCWGGVTVPSRSPPPPEIVTAQLRASGIMQTSAELHPLNEE